MRVSLRGLGDGEDEPHGGLKSRDLVERGTDLNSILVISPWVGLVGVLLASVAAYVTLRLYVRL